MLLPGDPGRALMLAQELLERPTMFNHNRGLWGYSGTAADGERLTIQSTGMGGPSAAIVISELADLGARRLIRVGTCGALDSSLTLGELLFATEAIAADGTSRAIGVAEPLRPDVDLAAAIQAANDGALKSATVVSTDLFYDSREDPERAWRDAGALAVEMETATLYALARQRGLQGASLLIVSDQLSGGRKRIDPDRLTGAERRLGAAALAGLGSLRAR